MLGSMQILGFKNNNNAKFSLDGYSFLCENLPSTYERQSNPPKDVPSPNSFLYAYDFVVLFINMYVKDFWHLCLFFASWAEMFRLKSLLRAVFPSPFSLCSSVHPVFAYVFSLRCYYFSLYSHPSPPPIMDSPN